MSITKSVLCYTGSMTHNRHIWQSWAHNLQRWGIGDWVALLLESAGPLSFVAAQVIYFSQPLLNHAFDIEDIEALASLLESETQTKAFAIYLQEVSHNDISALP